MDLKIFNDTTIQILLLTIISILGVHFYEMGYCRFFEIPTEYISFELSNSGYLLFTFLATFSIIIMLLDSYVMQILLLAKLKNKYLRVLTIIGLIGLLIFAFRGYLKSLTQQETLTLISVFFFGAILTLNKKKPDLEEEKKWEFSVNKFLSRKIGDLLGPLFMTASIFCTLMFCIGYIQADTQHSFMARPDNKTVLLRKYGNNVVFGILENGKINHITIERDYSTIDTLHIIKTK